MSLCHKCFTRNYQMEETGKWGTGSKVKCRNRNSKFPLSAPQNISRTFAHTALLTGTFEKRWWWRFLTTAHSLSGNSRCSLHVNTQLPLTLPSSLSLSLALPPSLSCRAGWTPILFLHSSSRGPESARPGGLDGLDSQLVTCTRSVAVRWWIITSTCPLHLYLDLSSC